MVNYVDGVFDSGKQPELPSNALQPTLPDAIADAWAAVLLSIEDKERPIDCGEDKKNRETPMAKLPPKPNSGE